ncbi:MAG: hypothetical protein ACRYFB_06810 [Janthinobacterium lividum]
MKKLLFLLWLLPAACFAQTDTTQIKPHDVYCRIFILSRSFKSGYSIGTDFGRVSNSNSLPDNEIKKLSTRLSSLDNDIDAINYMASQGWEVISYNSSLQRPDAYLLRKKAL